MRLIKSKIAVVDDLARDHKQERTRHSKSSIAFSISQKISLAR